MLSRIKSGLVISLALFTASQSAVADSERLDAVYEVSITNITLGQTFTPQLVTTHNNSISLFTLGKPATEELAILAESGDTAPQESALKNAGRAVADVKTIAGLLAPGKTATVRIGANRWVNSLSLAAMLIPTNDTFVAANTIPFPRFGTSTHFLRAYDSGSEINDQNCKNIPGPFCQGAGNSAPADTDEGYVYVSNGIHDLGTADAEGNKILDPATFTWQNPVAKLEIKRIR